MRVGVLRRIGSYLLDAIPIFATLSLLFSFFVGDLIEPEGHDELVAEFQEITEKYNTMLEPYFEEYEAGTLSEEDYNDIVENHRQYYELETRDHTYGMLLYYQRVLIYFIASFTLVYYAYNVITKGRTIGRKMMKIELQGKINWWTLLLREVIWKTGYWMLTLFIGGILLDIAMITFTNKKQAPRDFVTGITLKFEGVNYPF